MESESSGLMQGEAAWQHPCLQKGDPKPGLEANPRACTAGR